MPSLHLSEHRDGDEKKTKENKPDRPLKPSLEPLLLPTAASKGITSARDGESRFARALASGDASTRLRALDALVAWLFAKGNCSAAANSVTRDDMRKLWKGMFYSYWHSDLALVQKQLATRMAGIAGELQPELSALYLDAFYETLAREWAGLDRLRLDKFMLLVRCFVEATFSLAAGTKSASASASSASSSAAVASASSPWSPKRVERLLMPLSEAMCPPPDAPLLLSGSGLGLHLADVAAGELLRAVAASSSSSSAAASSSSPFQEGILAAVLPFSRAAASTQRPELGNRLAREFFSKIVAAIGAGREEEEEEEEEGASSKKKTSLLCPSLAVPLSKQLLSLASLPETRARNREVLYAAAAEMEAVAEKAKKEKKAQAKKEAVVVKEVSPEKGQQQQQQQREKHANSKRKKRPAAAEAAAPPTPPTAVPSKAAEQAAAAGAAAPEAKKAKTAAAATTATATPAPPPPTAAAVSAERGGGVGEEEARKAEKRVRWSFKSNLAHAVGGPVPPPHVRTPPGSAPRGSALKVKGAGVTTRRAAAAAAKAEAAEAEKGVGSKKGSNNNRARADAFF